MASPKIRSLAAAAATVILLLTTEYVSVTVSPPVLQFPDFEPGVLIVKFTGEAPVDERDLAACGVPSVNVLNRRFGVERMEKVFPAVSEKPRNRHLYYSLGLDRYFKFNLPDDADVLLVAEEYQKLPQVEYAGPDYIGYAATMPDDEHFDLQWGLHNTGQTGGKVDADIDAPEGWSVEKGLDNITIAILDTGVDWNHPDLDDKMWTNDAEANGLTGVDDDGNGFVDDYIGWDFVTASSKDVYPGEEPGPEDNNPMDFHGHGTFCAGIAAAETDNRIGIAGVAWKPRIMPVRVGFKYKIGFVAFTESSFANGIQYAADNGANVISTSLIFFNEVPLVKAQVEYAYGLNRLLCAAAGNTGTDWIGYPAGYDEVIAVGATLNNDTRRLTSNYGEKLEVLAPGTGIYSTWFDNTYRYGTGTSAATPHVAGLAALLFSQGHASNIQVREVIRLLCDDQIGPPEEDTPGWDQYYGWGRINMYKALTLPPIVHDVAVTDVTVEKTTVYEGDAVSINCTVENFGSFTETFNVTVYYDANVIENQKAVDVYEPRTLTFSWDTTAVPLGDYTISAYAHPVPGETDTADNVKADGIVTVTLPGDCDGDADVDSADLFTLAQSYGSSEGDSLYNTACDFDYEGDVDSMDLFILAANYGKHY